MHQLQEAPRRTRGPQLLDHTEAHTAAAMHRDSCRLVDHQQGVIFVDDGKLGGWRAKLLLRRHSPGRHTHDITRGQPMIHRYPPLVDTNLATPNRLVEVTLGHAFAFAHEEVIEALPGVIGADFPPADLRVAWRRGHWVLHHAQSSI